MKHSLKISWMGFLNKSVVITMSCSYQFIHIASKAVDLMWTKPCGIVLCLLLCLPGPSAQQLQLGSATLRQRKIADCATGCKWALHFLGLIRHQHIMSRNNFHCNRRFINVNFYAQYAHIPGSMSQITLTHTIICQNGFEHWSSLMVTQ